MPEASTGSGVSATCDMRACSAMPERTKRSWSVYNPPQLPDPANVAAVMRQACSLMAKAALQCDGLASRHTPLQPAAMPPTSRSSPPACIDLTLTDSDDEREPRTPSPLARSCAPARASPVSSCQTPLSLGDDSLGAAARLGMARKLRHATLCQGQPAATCQPQVFANGNTNCSSDRDDKPELRYSKRRALEGASGQPVPPARILGVMDSAADERHADGPPPSDAELGTLPARSASPQLRCSRRVQKRAYQVLASARRRPSLIIAYPPGGEDVQHYRESLDMTADVPSALGVSCSEAQVSESGRRWSRASCTRPDNLLTRLADAIIDASDMTAWELLLSNGSHEDALVHGMWKAVRSP